MAIPWCADATSYRQGNFTPTLHTLDPSVTFMAIRKHCVPLARPGPTRDCMSRRGTRGCGGQTRAALWAVRLQH